MGKQGYHTVIHSEVLVRVCCAHFVGDTANPVVGVPRLG
jgi:hypothetical protein